MKMKVSVKKAAILIFFCLASLPVIYWILDQGQEPLVMDKGARSKAPGQFVNLSRGITHYRFSGPESGRTVILIHGGMVSGMYAWEKNRQYLADKGFRVLMYDLYGRGYSDRVQEEYTPQLLFAQFEELLDSLRIKEPVSLAGLSLGSMVAIEYTRRHPEKVSKLMLLSPAARGKFNLRPVLKIPLLSDLLMAAYWFPRTVDNQMNEFYQPENFPEYEEKLRDMVRYRGYKDSNYSTWVNTLTYNMEPEIGEIGKAGVPVALVLGEHDPYVQADEAVTYRKLLPQLEVYTIPEAGHIVNYEKADTVNSLMKRFFSGT